MNEPTEHWLVRRSTIKRLWIGFVVVLIASVAAELLIGVQLGARSAEWTGFAAMFGFFACVGLVIVARLLGVVLKRDEGYYEKEDPR